MAKISPAVVLSCLVTGGVALDAGQNPDSTTPSSSTASITTDVSTTSTLPATPSPPETNATTTSLLSSSPPPADSPFRCYQTKEDERVKDGQTPKGNEVQEVGCGGGKCVKVRYGEGRRRKYLSWEMMTSFLTS